MQYTKRMLEQDIEKLNLTLTKQGINESYFLVNKGACCYSVENKFGMVTSGNSTKATKAAFDAYMVNRLLTRLTHEKRIVLFVDVDFIFNRLNSHITSLRRINHHDTIYFVYGNSGRNVACVIDVVSGNVYSKFSDSASYLCHVKYDGAVDLILANCGIEEA